MKQIQINKEYWFEYHCDETPNSVNYPAYLHSHQKCVVQSASEDNEMLPDEPGVFTVKFSDGYKCEVFENQLFETQDEFVRPDPIKI